MLRSLSLPQFQRSIEQTNHRPRRATRYPPQTPAGTPFRPPHNRNVQRPGKTAPGRTANRQGKEIHEQGLVSVLRELHDDLDRAVFQAYGWNDLAEKLVGRPGATTPWPEKPEDQQEAEEQLLQRLVDLNHQRAAEEAQGKIRWLRPEYQAPEETPAQSELATGDTDATDAPTKTPKHQITKKQTWPKTLQAQIRAVRDQLETAPMDPSTLASHYKRKPEKSVTQVLDALTELGMVKQADDGSFRIREN